MSDTVNDPDEVAFARFAMNQFSQALANCARQAIIMGKEDDTRYMAILLTVASRQTTLIARGAGVLDTAYIGIVKEQAEKLGLDKAS